MAYTITLVGCKGDEIEVIAMCMELCGFGMSEASKAVDHMPSVLFENISEESANKYKKLLENAGAILKIDETAASSAPDSFAFPEPDLGKMTNNSVYPSSTVQTATNVTPVAALAETKVQTQVVEEKKVEPEKEAPVRQQSIVEITPRSVDNPVSSEPDGNDAQTDNGSSKGEASEEPKYEYYGYCPKCGSSFITVKKVGGLFGSSKVKCVCEACKHKF